MEPGDIVSILQYLGDQCYQFDIFLKQCATLYKKQVYYESAKSLHGRNTPLQSGKYINLFTHYRPLNDPDWYTRDNPEGTPKPIIDVGECKLVGRSDQYSQGAVQCENNAIGPHLSPTMFQAKSASDLFHWWVDVGPKNEDFGETATSAGGNVGEELQLQFMN